MNCYGISYYYYIKSNCCKNNKYCLFYPYQYNSFKTDIARDKKMVYRGKSDLGRELSQMGKKSLKRYNFTLLCFTLPVFFDQ